MDPASKPVGRAGRDAAKRFLRGYGEITSVLRPGPDFVIIGAKRGGTTSLYNYVLEHPSVQPLFPGRQRIKGIHYCDCEFERGSRWYRSHFPLQALGRPMARPWLRPAITGEASPYYLFHPLAAERLARQAPGARLVVLLRDPAERAYSHYKERVRHGAEPLSFEAALQAEPERLRGEAERIVAEPGYHSIAHEQHSYQAQGRYLDMLPRWFELFGRDRFYLAASEDFYSDPGRVVNEVWSFLGLPPARLRSEKRYNYHQAPGLAPQTRQRLQSEFADHNDELGRLLGARMPWPAVPVPADAAVPPAASHG